MTPSLLPLVAVLLNDIIDNFIVAFFPLSELIDVLLSYLKLLQQDLLLEVLLWALNYRYVSMHGNSLCENSTLDPKVTYRQ